MALGDTHILLKKFRKAGYITKSTEDSEHRKCWHVEYPLIKHDFATGNNIVRHEYFGKVERYGSPDIKNKYAPLGRPVFYMTPRINEPEFQQFFAEQIKEIKDIVTSSPRAKQRTHLQFK